MAYARISHYWDDNTTTVVEVGTDEASHPDLLDQLTSRALRLWGETIGEQDVETDTLEIGERDE